jgi:hypothetical protein
MADAEQHPGTPSSSRVPQLRTSARGWHTIQLAVLGFVGLCGVLKGSDSSAPRGVQEVSGVLVLLALAIACWAAYLVGRAAWPLPGGRRAHPESEAELERDGRRLRMGLFLTFVAVVLVSTAAASSWWPSRTAASTQQLVRVATSVGTLCGTLTPGGHGSLTLDVQGGTTTIPLTEITALSPASAC